MKNIYKSPDLTVEILEKTDVLTDSENAYVAESSLNKTFSGLGSLADMIISGKIWED